VCEDNDVVQRLLECEKNLEECNNESKSWVDSLRELSVIKNAFVTQEGDRLEGKTILDIGTDCVKPLYIALKFEPDKIIGINEGLLSIGSDIETQSKLLTKTKLSFYDCSFFDEVSFRKILEKEGIDEFDFILLSKTVHHLRTGKCVNEEHKKNGKCPEDEKCCKYAFEPEMLFEKLLRFGKRIIIYEFFDPNDTDDDKIRGRGGYFTTRELKEALVYLSEKYRIRFIRPQEFSLDKTRLNDVDLMLREVDTICFYVEERG